jgi:uncharacterized protein (DUF952 family)
VRTIYHLTTPAAWQQTGPGPYRASSLSAEGFIHCSNADQLARVANLFYPDQPALLVLCIDATRLESTLRDEDPGIGELFPHVYGAINRDAIRDVRPLERGPDGRWAF